MSDPSNQVKLKLMCWHIHELYKEDEHSAMGQKAKEDEEQTPTS